MTAAEGSAAPMRRVLDDHDFVVDRRGVRHAPTLRCRVQLYVGDGHRPVAIATQSMPPSSQSLTNGAESLAEDLWRRFLPDSPEPPRLIQHYVFVDPGNGFQPTGRHSWMEVSFTREGDRLVDPSPGLLELDRLAELVGPLDSTLGGGYVLPVVEPEKPTTYQLYPVDQLPSSDPFRARACMPAAAAQGREGPRGCCWYHGGDWRQVNDIVASVLGLHRVGETVTLLEEDLLGRDAEHPGLIAQISARTLPDIWLEQAATSLLMDPLVIYVPTTEGWINGQHRGRAMLDAGVVSTIVEAVPWG